MEYSESQERERLLCELTEMGAEIKAIIQYDWHKEEVPNCGRVSLEQAKRIILEGSLRYEIELDKNSDYRSTVTMERLKHDVAIDKNVLEIFRSSENESFSGIL